MTDYELIQSAELEIECTACNGSGKVERDYETRHSECQICYGKGIRRTELGERVYQFVRQNLPEMIRDAVK